jgi:hypothetical protein
MWDPRFNPPLARSRQEREGWPTSFVSSVALATNPAAIERLYLALRGYLADHGRS